MFCFFTGLKKLEDWTKQSLKRRLQKSLSNDWIKESSSHKFPLRQFYVQLEWEKKIRKAMGSEREVLTSIHDFLQQIIPAGDGREMAQEGKNRWTEDASSVLIEGETRR